MKAEVTKEFPGRPDGEALARTIAVGEVITGDLAEVAVRDKLAKEIKEKADVEEDGEAGGKKK
ncbi:hypothetical protein [Mesorhizobium sp.]|uniref:hypothetical protein n=1 Tax=Mesorhizobium sp. TaxID=1871066 RepID=UPI000FE8247B|nr:hypothetical protein [Mesorhizobium sp.]RWK12529.1 MAG: hypothetical protein EOR39_02720 [Mesorhizobium sp.]